MEYVTLFYTEDTEPPIISNCPNDVTVIVELGLDNFGVATWTPPTATDVSGFAQITSESNRPGDSFPLGPTTVTYVFTDSSGNSAICSFIVTVDTGKKILIYCIMLRQREISCKTNFVLISCTHKT